MENRIAEKVRAVRVAEQVRGGSAYRAATSSAGVVARGLNAVVVRRSSATNGAAVEGAVCCGTEGECSCG